MRAYVTRQTFWPWRSSMSEMGLPSIPSTSASYSSKVVLDVKGNVSTASITSPGRNSRHMADGLPSVARSATNLPPDCFTCRPIPTLPMCCSMLSPFTHCRTIAGLTAAKSTLWCVSLSHSSRTWKMQCFAPPMPASVKVCWSVTALRGY